VAFPVLFDNYGGGEHTTCTRVSIRVNSIFFLYGFGSWIDAPANTAEKQTQSSRVSSRACLGDFQTLIGYFTI